MSSDARDRIIAIGDIHGCAHALDALLEAIVPRPTDRIICLGDVIDYGRDTNLVVERLMKLAAECRLVCLMGNHEELLLGALENERLKQTWLMLGGVATLNSYKFCGDIDVLPADHIEFIRSFRDCYELDEYLFVHASYDPELPLPEQPPHVLRWSLLTDTTPRRHFSGKTAIVGHTEQRNGEILDLECVQCIDTYCYGYGWLTALDVRTGRIRQASRWGALRDPGESVEGLTRARELLQRPEAG